MLRPFLFAAAIFPPLTAHAQQTAEPVRHCLTGPNTEGKRVLANRCDFTINILYLDPYVKAVWVIELKPNEEKEVRDVVVGAVCPAGYHGTSAPLTTKSGEALPNAVYTCARQ